MEERLCKARVGDGADACDATLLVVTRGYRWPLTEVRVFVRRDDLRVVYEQSVTPSRGRSRVELDRGPVGRKNRNHALQVAELVIVDARSLCQAGGSRLGPSGRLGIG